MTLQGQPNHGCPGGLRARSREPRFELLGNPPRYIVQSCFDLSVTKPNIVGVIPASCAEVMEGWHAARHKIVRHPSGQLGRVVVLCNSYHESGVRFLVERQVNTGIDAKQFEIITREGR